MKSLTAEAWAARARESARRGDSDQARKVIDEALTVYPRDARLWHAAGNLHLSLGDPNEGAERFAQAFSLQPSNFDYAVDQAIALSTANRHRAALSILGKVEMQCAGLAHYCSTRANAERGAGHAEAAARWYDRALAIEPTRPKALQGRANVALERGEESAVGWFDRALQVDPAHPYSWLGKAQALDVAGDTFGARTIMEQVVARAPQWLDGLRFLAQLRLAQGDKDFTSHYRTAMDQVPQDPAIPAGWCETLSGLDFNHQAAEVAKIARHAFPDLDLFAFLEAVNAGAAGDDDHAAAIFDRLERQDAERWLHEARHKIRLEEFALADGLLDKVIEFDPWSISAWALRGLVWRATGDKRSHWLDGREELVRLLPLHAASRLLPMVIPLLHRLHDNSPLPLGQSLRGGSQTRGILFDRTEPELAALQQAIVSTVEDYRAGLPPADPTHPLLRHRDTPWALQGSWSVRLNGHGDFHIAHIHPQGIVSSALYLELPDLSAEPDQGGWLEIGRPPPDLRLDLEPIHQIEPKPGHLALFPSTQYHGTRAFTGSRRMTVAFDIGLGQG